MSILVIDVGTSSVRALVVSPDGGVTAEVGQPFLPDTPFPGLVEFDAAAMADAALGVANAALREAGVKTPAAVGISNQRASTVVWDRASGEPVGPGIGWQDLRTIGECLAHRAAGFSFAPNESATKLEHVLNSHDPDRRRDLCFGTVDSWIAWNLSAGSVHVTDASNAGVTGLVDRFDATWNHEVLDGLTIPATMMPTICDTTGVVGEAKALTGAPPIAALVGDQQASLVGQSAVASGTAKCTFGTGAMLNLVVDARPDFELRGGHGSYPVVAWRRDGELTWAVEAIILAAGTNVEWLRDDLGLISSAAESHVVASQCTDTGGVMFVPDLLGAGTPEWDYGSRGTLLGLTRGTGRAEIVRAVLEGVAMRGADLLAAAEGDTGTTVSSLRVDGGMSTNPTFVQALANAIDRPVERSPIVEATALGAAYLAGLAVDTWSGWSDIDAAWQPAAIVEPNGPVDRDRWREAVGRAGNWHEDLSSLDF